MSREGSYIQVSEVIQWTTCKECVQQEVAHGMPITSLQRFSLQAVFRKIMMKLDPDSSKIDQI